MSEKLIKLNSGATMPKIGLGTWQAKPGEVEAAVKTAIDCGYRHLDCAFLYLNETEVGEAIQAKIKDGTVKREDLFVTSKIWSTCHAAEDVRPAIMDSMKMLQLDYLDLYLIHWPFSLKKKGKDYFPHDENGVLEHTDVYYMDTWKEMEKCVDEGLLKSIGVSNFSSRQVQDVMDKGRIKPAVLQVEIHPYLSQEKLVKFCQDRGVVMTAYSPLGSNNRPWAEPNPQPLLENKDIISIGKKYGKTPAQVMIRWLLQRDITAIPKSCSPARIKENLNVYDFKLSSDDMSTISAINQDLRLVLYGNGTTDIIPTAPYYPFNDEF